MIGVSCMSTYLRLRTVTEMCCFHVYIEPFLSVEELSLEEDAEEATSQGTKVNCKYIRIFT